MEKVDNVLIFEDDNEINDYCVSSSPRITTDTELNVSYYTYDLTDEYHKAVNDGCWFNVSDPKSRVMKNGLLYRGLITIPIERLKYKV